MLFFGLLLIYTFKVLALTSLIYLTLIPISYLHFQKIKTQNFENDLNEENIEDLEDIL